MRGLVLSLAAVVTVGLSSGSASAQYPLGYGGYPAPGYGPVGYGQPGFVPPPAPMGYGGYPGGFPGMNRTHIRDSGNGVGNVIIARNQGGGVPFGGGNPYSGYPFGPGGFGMNINVVANSGNGVGNLIKTVSNSFGGNGININVIANSGNGAGNVIKVGNR